MQMIRCTQKLIKKVPLEPDEELAVPSEDCWHANVIRIDHHECVLITHDLTLFSLFIPGVSKAGFKHFSDMFGQALFKTMRHFDFTQKEIEYMLESCREIQVGKTNNRSVMGSMNDMKQMIDLTVYHQAGLASTGMGKLFQVLNHTPFKAIDYNYPEERMRAMLGSI